MFNLALDCKLGACDFIKLKVSDIVHGKTIQSRAMLIQQKTGTPVQFEMTKKTRITLQKWISFKSLHSSDYLFGSRVKNDFHLTTRQYGRIVIRIASIGLDVTSYGTHSMRRTKAILIYKKNKALEQFRFCLVIQN